MGSGPNESQPFIEIERVSIATILDIKVLTLSQLVTFKSCNCIIKTDCRESGYNFILGRFMNLPNMLHSVKISAYINKQYKKRYIVIRLIRQFHKSCFHESLIFFLPVSLILLYGLTLLALLHRKRHFATLLSFISRAFPSYKLIVQLCPLPWLDNKYLSGIISLHKNKLR